MKEFPVFVPAGGEHVAAVVSAPDAEPRGLVMLATGLGAPRSHRYQVWAAAAERLAGRDIASVRFDYPGLHDSTGSAEEVGPAVPILEAREVVALARAATGADRVVAVGNCWGAQLAVALAADLDECVGAMSILPETVEPGGLDTAFRRAAGRRVLGLLRSRRMLRRLAGPLRRIDSRVNRALAEVLPRALERSRVLLLYDREHLDGGPHAVGRIQALVDRLPEERRRNFELRVISGRGLARFGSVEVQDTLLDTIVHWVEGCFSEAENADVARGDPLSSLGSGAPRHSGRRGLR